MGEEVTTTLREAKARDRAFYRGVRACIARLHELAREMNDPHAKAVLNSAAFDLGVNKPGPGSQLESSARPAWPVSREAIAQALDDSGVVVPMRFQGNDEDFYAKVADAILALAPAEARGSQPADVAICTTDCFECGHALEGPWCPACNPPVAWSLVFSETYGVNTDTAFKTRAKAEAYAAQCSSPKPRVVPLAALPTPPKA